MCDLDNWFFKKKKIQYEPTKIFLKSKKIKSIHTLIFDSRANEATVCLTAT